MKRLLLLLLSVLWGVKGFDVSWIPAGDGPLPLSAKYRQQLARLCELDAAGDSLAKGLSRKDLSRVRSSCAKLSRDKGVGGGDYGALLQRGGKPSPLGLAIFALVLGALLGGPALQRRFRAGRTGARLGSGGGANAQGAGGGGVAVGVAPRQLTPEQHAALAAMREARLSRLSAKPKQS
jgi:hypothetical protein